MLYLAIAGVNEEVLRLSSHAAVTPLLFVAACVCSALFWGTTPAMLVPSVNLSKRLFLTAGLVGAVVNVVVLRLVVRVVFPMLLSGWDGFGPVGVAFTIMTWCGALGVAWVVVACVGAVLFERSWASA